MTSFGYLHFKTNECNGMATNTGMVVYRHGGQLLVISGHCTVPKDAMLKKKKNLHTHDMNLLMYRLPLPIHTPTHHMT